ncbi:Synaptotagmin-1 [Eumeta japonica]|uniref:Synaptotagmin-1 n=1 Tax=Eumeta variegata TaxID=151549 RepID=A0A4C1YJE7_EUMVA|nr:Synaptotagmin-1 [Eumeta japonica]
MTDISDYIARLRSFVRKLQPSPASRHGERATFVYKDLATTTHVFLREDTIRSCFQPAYTGPHESHRGSSPAIRTFAPDGRSLEAGVGLARSPSPLRAASLDVRGVQAAPAPAHGSLASLSDTPASPSWTAEMSVSAFGASQGVTLWLYWYEVSRGREPQESRWSDARRQIAPNSIFAESFLASRKVGAPRARKRLRQPFCRRPANHTFSPAGKDGPERYFGDKRRIDRSNSLVESSSGVGPLSPGAGAALSALGALQPDLYTKREAPLFIGLEGAGPSLGRLHLRLKYDFDRSDLEVHLIEAHDLAGYEAGGFNDPYVRVSLLPEVDTRVRQTPVHRNEANPFFDQHFKFPVSHDELGDKTLLLQIVGQASMRTVKKAGGHRRPWILQLQRSRQGVAGLLGRNRIFDGGSGGLMKEKFSRNEVMGSVRVPLSRVEVAGGAEVWAELSRERRPPEELQELLLSLSYLPSAERLTVVVLKARNLLPPQEGKDALDVYVKVYLLVNGKRVKKKKTNRKDIANPVWNEALSFSLPSANLQEASIEASL